MVWIKYTYKPVFIALLTVQHDTLTIEHVSRQWTESTGQLNTYPLYSSVTVKSRQVKQVFFLYFNKNSRCDCILSRTETLHKDMHRVAVLV